MACVGPSIRLETDFIRLTPWQAERILGWKSDAMLDRYHIVNEADRGKALQERFQHPKQAGKVTAQ